MEKNDMTKKSPSSSLLDHFSGEDLAEAQDFLARIEERRLSYKPNDEVLSPMAQRLIGRIREAFAGVTCYRETRVLMGGEAEDEYLTPNAQALLAPLEERADWESIPDDLLFACSCSLCYAGPLAYQFLLPRFMVGTLRGVVDIYPGSEPSSDLESYVRGQMECLTPPQRQCLADFLNLECLEWGGKRDRFLPWEHDEYRAEYAARMDYSEYGALLVQRYAEREGVQS